MTDLSILRVSAATIVSEIDIVNKSENALRDEEDDTVKVAEHRAAIFAKALQRIIQQRLERHSGGDILEVDLGLPGSFGEPYACLCDDGPRETIYDSACTPGGSGEFHAIFRTALEPSYHIAQRRRQEVEARVHGADRKRPRLSPIVLAAGDVTALDPIEDLSSSDEDEDSAHCQAYEAPSRTRNPLLTHTTAAAVAVLARL